MIYLHTNYRQMHMITSLSIPQFPWVHCRSACVHCCAGCVRQ